MKLRRPRPCRTLVAVHRWAAAATAGTIDAGRPTAQIGAAETREAAAQGKADAGHTAAVVAAEESKTDNRTAAPTEMPPSSPDRSSKTSAEEQQRGDSNSRAEGLEEKQRRRTRRTGRLRGWIRQSPPRASLRPTVRPLQCCAPSSQPQPSPPLVVLVWATALDSCTSAIPVRPPDRTRWALGKHHRAAATTPAAEAKVNPAAAVELAAQAKRVPSRAGSSSVDEMRVEPPQQARERIRGPHRLSVLESTSAMIWIAAAGMLGARRVAQEVCSWLEICCCWPASAFAFCGVCLTHAPVVRVRCGLAPRCCVCSSSLLVVVCDHARSVLIAPVVSHLCVSCRSCCPAARRPPSVVF